MIDYLWLLIALPLLGALTLILFWRHRSNIRNLLSGAEGKIKGEEGSG